MLGASWRYARVRQTRARLPTRYGLRAGCGSYFGFGVAEGVVAAGRVGGAVVGGAGDSALWEGGGCGCGCGYLFVSDVDVVVAAVALSVSWSVGGVLGGNLVGVTSCERGWEDVIDGVDGVM